MAQIFDSYDGETQPPAGCKRCGSTDCIWVHTGVRWKLVEENGKRHVCVTSDGMVVE